MIDLRQGRLGEQMNAVRNLLANESFINQQGQKFVVATVVRNEAGDVICMESITTDPAPRTV